jgi:hypothetical protein
MNRDELTKLSLNDPQAFLSQVAYQDRSGTLWWDLDYAYSWFLRNGELRNKKDWKRLFESIVSTECPLLVGPDGAKQPSYHVRNMLTPATKITNVASTAAMLLFTTWCVDKSRNQEVKRACRDYLKTAAMQAALAPEGNGTLRVCEGLQLEINHTKHISDFKRIRKQSVSHRD